MRKLLLIAAVCALACVSAFAANTPGQHNVQLTWDPDSSCIAPGCYYNVYRVVGTGDPCAGQPTPIATNVPTNSYLDTPVAAGQTLSYRVTEALQIGGESACSTGVQPTVSNSMGKTPPNLQASGH